MRRLRSAIVILLVLSLAPAVLAKVIVDHDPSADFSKLKTYAWIAGTPAPNPLGEKRIRAALDEKLQSLGFKPVEESPDLLVATHATKSTQQHISVDSYGYGYGRYHSGWGTSTARVHSIPIGTLVVDLIDADSKELIWRGEGSDTLSDKVEKNQKKLSKVLKKMFKKFPPGSE